MSVWGKGVDCSLPAWRGLILYAGGFTFDERNPDQYLKIPNLIAAKRFGRTVLDRHGLTQTMGHAVKSLESTGDIRLVLASYRKLMAECDVGWDDFGKDEGTHRDLLRNTILENPGLEACVEYEVIKASSYDPMFETSAAYLSRSWI